MCRIRPTGIPDRARAVLAGDLGSGKLCQELARPVEVGHLQISRADAALP
jgi:hypothetical protein